MSAGTDGHQHTFGHPNAVKGQEADVDIDIHSPDLDDTLERLAVRRIGDDLYRVCCIPFFLYDVCLDDVIRAAGLTKDSPGRISERVEDAGRSVYRVSPTPPSYDEIRNVASTAASMGLAYEICSDALIAIDVDGAQEPHVISDLLVEGAAGGRWVWETGRQ